MWEVKAEKDHAITPVTCMRIMATRSMVQKDFLPRNSNEGS